MYVVIRSFIPATINVQGAKLLRDTWRLKRTRQTLGSISKEINVASYFYLQYKKEKEYSKTIGIQEWHNIPSIYRKKKVISLTDSKSKEKIEQEIWIRETGIITYQLVFRKEISPPNPQKITSLLNETIKEMKRLLNTEFNQVLLQEVIPLLKEQIKETEKTKARPLPKDTKKLIESIGKMEKGRAVTFIFFYSKKKHDFILLKEWLQTDLRILGGSNCPIIHVRENDLRYHSRGLHVLVSKDPFLRKKSKKMLQLEIVNALHIAYSIPLVLKSALKCLNMSQTQKSGQKDRITCEIELLVWESIIHYLNPFILGGKANFDSLFVKAVVRSWFIRADLLLKLREEFIGFFESIANSKKFMFYAPIIISELVKLPLGKNVELKALSSKVKSPKSSAEIELKKRIIDILVKHEQNILSEQVDLKHERGLTASKITQMLYIPNGIQTAKIRNYLEDLVRAGFIEWAPYLGPGRRKGSKVYFLSENFSGLREIYFLTIKEKLHFLLKKLNNQFSQET